ncbi:MAG: helix-turn-helix protein [Pseudomonadota bacterium]|jgi:DNA-binding transcriptional regulator YiaG
MNTKKHSPSKNLKAKRRKNIALNQLNDDAIISADDALKLAGKPPLTLGSLVRTLRHLSNKTQSDVANSLGVSVAFLSAVERGDKNLPPRHARALSKVLSYSEEVILEKILEHVLAEAKGHFEVTVRKSAG